LEAIPQFRKQFKGKFVTETMLIQGLNDTADEIEKIAQYIAKLSPEVSYIAIPTRPTAFVDIVPASEQMVAFAYQQFTNHKIQTELLIGYEGNAFATSGNFAEDLLSITAVHPMREEAVVELMKNSNAKPETLLSLIEQQLIEKVVYNQNTYYLRKFPKQKITCKK
jgi:wyosine [tRNA(Phe)-imidazoG37] synthetase (radical SAM superfamily)